MPGGWQRPLASRPSRDAPHVILLPEVTFDRQRFLAKVNEAVEEHGHCTVVVSEGVRDAEGRYLSDSGSTDAFGHTQLGGVALTIASLVRQELGHKYHWAVADYLQRSARHIASATDVEQAYAVGRAAVELALEGHTAVMPIIKRLSDDPYEWEVTHAELSEIANTEACVPAEYIREDGFGITEACRRYLRPLIAGEDYPPYRNGLPDYARLRKVGVPRKLQPFK